MGTLGLLFANQDAGFTRDESFYFDFAERYQEWFVDVEEAAAPEAREAALGREPTVRVWSGNFEHPPLAKVLFGLSWRAFARKDREASGLRFETAQESGDSAKPRVRFWVSAGRATGFAVGRSVFLLRPQRQGELQNAPERILASGSVTRRTSDRAEVEVDAVSLGATTADALIEQCTKRPTGAPSDLPVTGCMARESKALDFLSESQAMRLPGIISGALAVMLTFLLGEALFGWVVGLFGALLFLFVPEHFFHAYLACFDMPIVAAQLFTLYAFWRSLSDRRWALIAAIGWGLALLTKHNAFFVPVSLVLFWLFAGRSELRISWHGWRRGPTLRLPSLPLSFLLMPPVALGMLFVLWPRLWYGPLQSLRDWFAFHLHHEHYMQYWFGEPLQVPPFPIAYPFEKTALTYPEVFLVLLAFGCAFLLSPRLRTQSDEGSTTSGGRAVTVFTLANGLIPILVIALPSTPIFGGIKHWMTGAPLLALVASYGLFRTIRAARIPRVASVALAATLIVQPAKASVENAWLGTHYYNALFAGGLQGAADKRLMRIFWGHEARYACEWLNSHAPFNARVYWQDATWGTYDMYQREGWLRRDIRYVSSPDQADIALNETLQALWEGDVRTRRALGVPGPLWVLERHGVPYLNVYVRPRLGLAGP
jgi:hypothetical protein